MKFERCFNASFVPTHLLKQLPDRDFDADNFYQFMKIALQSPTQLLYLLMSDDNVIQGFLWCEINILEKVMFVNILSVDKSLWKSGEMVELAVDYLKVMFKELGLNKVLWTTDRPALFEKMGFKKSEDVLLEYTGE